MNKPIDLKQARTGTNRLVDPRIRDAARYILNQFDHYTHQFRDLTTAAIERFEKKQWRLARQEAKQRMILYETTLIQVHNKLRDSLESDLTQIQLWIEIKETFSGLIQKRSDIGIAKTFFNSVTRKILETVGINRNVEFFDLESEKSTTPDNKSVYRRYIIDGHETAACIEEILSSFSFNVPYENKKRDAQRVADELSLYIWPSVQEGSLDYIDLISAPFFRNRVAYLVGRLVHGNCTAPFIMPLYNGRKGIYVDAALFRERQASIIFGFAHNSFSVLIDHHTDLINFLRSILPRKPIGDLYTSVGYYKHGKTEFYRYLHKYVHESHNRFKIAPGQEGSVMIGFTLRNFRFVLKVVKDRPCFLRTGNQTNKTTDRQTVMERYRNIRYQDYVGRLVDTQEFENLRFKRKRFTLALLREFRLAAVESVSIGVEYVTIHHCYLQRRVTPLPMYIALESNPEIVRDIILDFGYYLKDLASVGIFPADLFNIWNCGITSRRRVVLFDHDDVTSLRKIKFRAKPKPRNYWEEIQREEDRIVAGPNDFFIDEIERFLGIPSPLIGIFRKVHGDLFTLEYWQKMQRHVRRGDVVNIIPYDRARRFEDNSGARILVRSPRD